MIRRIIHISALALGLVLAGCSVIQEDERLGEGLEIKFTATVGSFQVKASDAGFDVGDQVGLFADSPVNASNVRLTWDGTSLVPDTRIFWTPGDERQVSFSAYYPYDPEKVRYNWTESFVNADQSTAERFLGSDILVARSAASSADGVVNLQFRHIFSKIVIHIDNQVEGLEIAEVYLADVLGRYEGNIWGDYYPLGVPGTVKACKALSPTGETVWAVIIPSYQYCKPRLLITTADGKQFSSEARYEYWFESSCRYNAYATIDGESVLTEFSSDVVEWTDNNDLEFPLPGREIWSVIGNIHGTNWDKDFPLFGVSQNNDYYYGLIYCGEGQEFKLRKDASWDVNRGLASAGVIQPGDYNLVRNGANIGMEKEGVYELAWSPRDNSFLNIFPVGENTTWTVTGSLEGMDWSRDHKADTWAVNSEGLPLLVYRVKYREGKEFKLRFIESWEWNYGYDWDAFNYDPVFGSGSTIRLVRDGGNIRLNRDGIYDLYFDLYAQTLSVQWVDELPVSAPAAISIDGDFSDWDALDSGNVSMTVGDPNAVRPALTLAKVCADDAYIYVYFEWDPSMIRHEPDVEHVPFHCYLNTDGDSRTGGFSDLWTDACIDLLLEGFIYPEGKNVGSYDPGAYAWIGEINGEGWSWSNEIMWGGICQGAGVEGRYEFLIDRQMLADIGYPMADVFSIGFDIEQSWDFVGVLPNVCPRDDNPNGLAPTLWVTTY